MRQRIGWTGEPMGQIDPGRRPPKFLRRCLYCPATNGLTREHIVPFSFGGEWVIQEASCPKCSKITHEFETACATELFSAMRLQFGYPSRHKKTRAKGIDFTVITPQGAAKRRTPIELTPTIPIFCPVFDMPGLLQGLEPDAETIVKIWGWTPKQGDEQKNLITGTGGAHISQVSYQVPFHWHEFGRMIAKIAHASAVAIHDIKPEDLLLPPYILGDNPNITHVVGTSAVPAEAEGSDNQYLIEFGTVQLGQDRYFTVKIELFRFIGAPCYWAVVCKADDRLTSSVLNQDHRAGP